MRWLLQFLILSLLVFASEHAVSSATAAQVYIQYINSEPYYVVDNSNSDQKVRVYFTVEYLTSEGEWEQKIIEGRVEIKPKSVYREELYAADAVEWRAKKTHEEVLEEESSAWPFPTIVKSGNLHVAFVNKTDKAITLKARAKLFETQPSPPETIQPGKMTAFRWTSVFRQDDRKGTLHILPGNQSLDFKFNWAGEDHDRAALNHKWVYNIHRYEIVEKDGKLKLEGPFSDWKVR